MNILHVVHSLDLSGRSRVIADLCRGMADRGMECAVACLSATDTVADGACSSARAARNVGDVVARILRALRRPVRSLLQLAINMIATTRATDTVATTKATDTVATTTPERAAAAVPRVNLGKSDGISVIAAWRLYRLARAVKADVLHSHGRGALAYAVAAKRMGGARRLVHTVHRADGDMVCSWAWMRKTVLSSVDTVIAVSSAARRSFAAANDYPESRIGLIFNGVDVSRFDACSSARACRAVAFPGRRPVSSAMWGCSSARVARSQAIKMIATTTRGDVVARVSRAGHPDTVATTTATDTVATTTIGSVANLSPDKDIETLVRAFALMRSARPNARLAIVGDGPEMQRAKETARVSGSGEYVDFLGSRDDVPALLGRFDVFVLSTKTEGLGLALIEAMAAGVPVVAARVGGVPEVVEDGVTGRLFKPGDAEDLHKAVTAVLEDPDATRRMTLSARRRVEEKFSSAQMVEKYERVYRVNGEW